MASSKLFVSPQTPDQQRVAILNHRRRLDQIFGRAIFGERAWEMLLLLYSQQSGPKLRITQIAELASLPKTTAIRWLQYLEENEIVRREPVPADKRAVSVELTDWGRALMELYLSETALGLAPLQSSTSDDIAPTSRGVSS